MPPSSSLPPRRLLLPLIAASLLLLALGLVALLPARSQGPAPAADAGGAAFEASRAEAPAPAPEVAFEDADGGTVTLADFRGKVVVLNLWATWCAPCRLEMPSLDRLQAELGGPDLEVVALSVDRAGAGEVAGFLAEVGAGHLGLYRDPTMAATRALGAPGLPTTLILDREGREVARVLGEREWDGEAAKAYLRRIMAGGG